MPIIRINELPEGSGNLSDDDVFIFMDDPSGSGITKKINLSQISSTIFDQDLNTFDSVAFNQIAIGGSGGVSYYVMANVDGNTVTSSDGLNWNGPYDLNMGIDHVATNGTTIVAIDDEEIGYTSFSSPSGTTIVTATVSGITNIDLNQIIYGGGYFVLAGDGNDGVKTVPVYGYSSDGSNWTFKTVTGSLANTLADDDDENCGFSDIDYNGVGWNFAVDSNNVGGGVYTTDITETFTDGEGGNYFSMVPGQQVAWNGNAWYYINSDEGSGFNANTDPRIDEWDGPYNPWASSQEDLGISITNNISDTFCGGNGYLVLSDGDGHISFSSDNGQTWTYITPIPYTATITNITYVDNKYQLSLTGSTSHDDGEKITISGSSVTEYDGVYFLDSDNFLYIDYELITPWIPEVAAFSGTANLTWSHGQYIDAMDYVNGYFYIGNDDEQIARSNDLINWTIVDDRDNAFEYWNDFNGYSSGEGDDLVINGNEIIFSDGSVQNSATFKITTVDLHNGDVQNAQVLAFDNNSYQSIITGPIPASGNNAQRIIVQGRRGQGNGEGGDVYLWGGDADTNGGDIKIYAGDSDSNESGNGGYVNIDAGNGYNQGGQVSINAGNSSIQGGSVNINAGYPSGNVNINTHAGSWAFNTDGTVDLPSSTLNVGLNSLDLKSSAYLEFYYQSGPSGTSDNYIEIPNNNSYAYLWTTYDGTHIQNIRTNDGTNPSWNHEWHFNNSGTLILPASGSITFPDSTVQTSAGIPSSTELVPNSVSITNMVSISQENYDALVTKDSNTLYVIS